MCELLHSDSSERSIRIAFAPLCIDYDEKPPTMEIMLRQRARWAKGFISLLSKRIAEPSDIIGNIHWLSPYCPRYSGLIMLLIPAYGALHNILYGYYPYTYSYMPLNLWFILTGLIYGLQAYLIIQTIWPKGLKKSSLSSSIQRFLSLLVCIIHQSIFRQVMGKHKNHSWICHWQTSNQTINRARANTKDNACLIYY